MTEFKFSCPSCGQNFKVDSSVCAKKIECPSCRAKIIAPEVPKDPNTVPVATLETPAPAKPAATPAPRPAPAAPPPAPPVEPRKSPEVAPRPQIPILTSEIKQEIINSVRALLSNKDKWMPRVNEEGQPLYAARMEGGKIVPVPIDAPEATHFSLLGAVLREFNRRNVMRTAAGRKRFLDKAIPEAMNAVIKLETGKLPDDFAKVPLTHQQALKVLDLLEKKFDGESEYLAQAMEQQSRIGKTRLMDIAMKLESEAILTNEEIATALVNELEEIKVRLAAIEARAGIEHAKEDGQKPRAGEKKS